MSACRAHHSLRLRATLEYPMPRTRKTVSPPAGGVVTAGWERFIITPIVNPDGEPLPHPGFSGEFVQDDVGLYVAKIVFSAPAAAGTITIAASGDAVAAVNYTLPSGLSIPVNQGDAFVDVTVSVLAAGAWFNERTLYLDIVSATEGIELGTDLRFTLPIRPATAAPTVQFSFPGATRTYDDWATGNAFIEVALDAVALDDINVWCRDLGTGSADPADYTFSSDIGNPLVIPAGSLSPLLPSDPGGLALTWTGAAPVGNETVVAEIWNDASAEKNLYTFSESGAKEVISNGFPNEAIAGQPWARGDYVGESESEVQQFKNPDGTLAHILYPVDDPDTEIPVYHRKSYEQIVPGGFDQLVRLEAKQTFSAYVHRPDSPGRLSIRWSINLYARAEVITYAFFFGWGADKPTFEVGESKKLGLLDSYVVTIQDAADAPTDPWLNGPHGTGWYRVACEINPTVDKIGGATQRLFWPAQSVSGQQTDNQAINNQLGVCVWGFQYEYTALTAYQPRESWWYHPKGGASRSGQITATFTVTP